MTAIRERNPRATTRPAPPPALSGCAAGVGGIVPLTILPSAPQVKPAPAPALCCAHPAPPSSYSNRVIFLYLALRQAMSSNRPPSRRQPASPSPRISPPGPPHSGLRYAQSARRNLKTAANYDTRPRAYLALLAAAILNSHALSPSELARPWMPGLPQNHHQPAQKVPFSLPFQPPL